MNNYNEEKLMSGLKELEGMSEFLPLTTDLKLQKEFERVDDILTDCLNYYYDVAKSFFLTTDEMLAFKKAVYSGKIFNKKFDFTTASEEEKKRLIDYLQKWCDFYSVSQNAYNYVEPFIAQASVRAGLQKKGASLKGISCKEEFEYAFFDCAVFSDAILSFMTADEIRDIIGYVDKKAASDYLINGKYLKDKIVASELESQKRQKRRVMKVWLGKIPKGEELRRFKEVRSCELTSAKFETPSEAVE